MALSLKLFNKTQLFVNEIVKKLKCVIIKIIKLLEESKCNHF